MSTTATPPIQQKPTATASSNSSDWSREPPTPVSNLSSGVATPIPPQNGPNGSAVPASHSRKGSIMVGGGVDIKKGPINFGTMDAPLSSSPAAPSTLGMHLTDAVKSFGSIEADSSEANAIKAPIRRASNLSPPIPSPAPEKKKLDMHSLFTSKAPPMQTPQADRRLSQSSFQPNGQPQQNGTPYQMRPDAYMQQQGGFRPPQPNMMAPGQVRPNGMPRPMPQYPQAQYMQYPGYYPSYYDQQQQYPPQWAPQQHPQNFRPPPQPSPAPSTAQLPNSGGPSPIPTPPATRPPNMIPSTPSRPLTMQPSFTPQQSQFAMSGGAPSFTPTPRVSKALKFTRPDGTELNIKDVAAAAKGPSPAATPAIEAPAPVPAAVPVPVETPAKKKVPSLPVIVRIESEDQKKARLAEEEQRDRIRKVEEQEEKERKERKERQAREETERKAKEAEEAERKAEEERVAEEKRKQEEEEREQQEAQKKLEEEAATKKAEEAREAARLEEQNKPTPAASPLASPNLSGLPPKPSTSRRPTSVEINNDASVSTPLSSARPIEDLQSIVYPSSYKPPSPDLNKDAQPGKYRYDREFLMQFMSICREKPEGLPPLDEIGLEADSSSGFGNRAARGGRPSMPPPRGVPAGLGIRQPSGMGSFGMGNFGANTVKGTTSESRYENSIRQMQMGVVRSTSKGTLPTLTPMMGGRGAHGSGRGKKRAPPPLDPGVAPLAVSSNSWVKARPTNTDEKEPAFIERKVKALLNKLTEEKFDSISNQILEWANKSRDDADGLHLKLVIKQVFEKATDEAHWSAMYAKLCRKLLERLDPEITEEIDGKQVSGGTLFRRYLLGRCQMDFESGWKAREDAAAAAAAKSAEDKELLATQKEGEEIVMLSDEYYIAQKAKRRGLGLVQLIGELFKLEMISKNVIRTCLLKLVGERPPEDLDEEDVESACKLLTTIGEQYEQKSPEETRIVIGHLQKILQADVMPSRVRFMIMDVLDIKKQGWKSRNKQAGVMTIAEIHQQAAREQAEKAAAVQRESISRGGSRAGHSRQQPGEWQAVAPGARPLQRPDTSNLGRNFSSSGMSSGPVFSGPQSHFANKRKPGAAGATPPMSRQASTTNMFNVLGAEEEKPAEPEAVRPKLNLKPRTKPLPGEDGEGEDGDDGERSEASEPASEGDKPMSVSAAQTKIAADSKELWGEKDQGGSRNPADIVAYFESLPEEHRSLLAEQLVDDLFRICKIKDVEVVVDGWTSAVEQNLVSTDVLKKGIEKHMPSLDDDSIDFPKAYAAIAMLMRSLSLSDEEISALLEMVDVFGEPKITPKDKLDRELKALDSASS